MSEIAPGDWVECVDVRPVPDGRECWLVLGARYQIAALWDYLPYAGKDDGWMECSVTLVDVEEPGEGLAWGLYRFKPIKDDGLNALLNVQRKRKLELTP